MSRAVVVTPLEFKLDKTLMEGVLGDFPGPLSHIKVDETKWEPLWNRLVREHHYLGYESVIGSRVKYLLALGDRIVGAISFCSAAYKLGPRDKYVGWDESTRLAMLPHLVNNNRFLILPWVKVRNLASHVLTESLKRLRVDWKKWYGVEPYMVETFVDPERFAGTCYAAASWVRLGSTKGYGRRGNGFVYHGHPKDLYVKVMSRRFTSSFHPNTDRLPVSDREELLAVLYGVPVKLPDSEFNKILKGINSEGVGGMLADHLLIYRDCMGRSENMAHLAISVKGRLSDVENKTNQSLAEHFLLPSQRRAFNNFTSSSLWDDLLALSRYQDDFATTFSAENAMLTVDGCDFPKQGKMSAGVQRQYCGTLGKVDNCQAGVFLGYAGPEGYGLFDYLLYLPQKWLDEMFAEKRRLCRIPEDTVYMTKNEIALYLIHKAYDSGKLKARWLGCDSAFGRDSSFLDSLPAGLKYFADVPSNQMVFASRPEMVIPEYRGRGHRPTVAVPDQKPVTVAELIARADMPATQVCLGMGSNGPIFTTDKCLRVVEVRNGKPGKDVWLYSRVLENGDVKYSLCNEPEDASFEDIRTPATMRWSIEQSFKECKDHLGMDQYEVRSLTGWRRHMLITLISHLFVNKVRHQVGFKIKAPLAAPYPNVPVTLDEYRDAAIQMRNDEEITNSKISAFPEKMQQFTFSNWKNLLSSFFPSMKDSVKVFKTNSNSYAETFQSRCKKKNAEAINGAASHEGEQR